MSLAGLAFSRADFLLGRRFRRVPDGAEPSANFGDSVAVRIGKHNLVQKCFESGELIGKGMVRLCRLLGNFLCQFLRRQQALIDHLLQFLGAPWQARRHSHTAREGEVVAAGKIRIEVFAPPTPRAPPPAGGPHPLEVPGAFFLLLSLVPLPPSCFFFSLFLFPFALVLVLFLFLTPDGQTRLLQAER